MARHDRLGQPDLVGVREMLKDVYSEPIAKVVLWELLIHRESYVNISHKKMPTWEEHSAFVASKPYKAWYLIQYEGKWAGAIYLTLMNEIGIHLFKHVQNKGVGKEAVAELMKLHPAKRYLANIAPHNINSVNFFERQGFKLIQRTYELAK
jgi:RimJ/RimL family protein N-acetyltransferase